MEGQTVSHYRILEKIGEGGIPKRLTQDQTVDADPSWSRDGKWIYFASNRGGSRQIWRMPAEGGEAVQVTENGGLYAEESWDGKYLYYADTIRGGSIWRIPVEGGEVQEIVRGIDHYQAWDVGRSGVYYKTVESQARCLENTIWYQDVDSGQTT